MFRKKRWRGPEKEMMAPTTANKRQQGHVGVFLVFLVSVCCCWSTDVRFGGLDLIRLGPLAESLPSKISGGGEDSCPGRDLNLRLSPAFKRVDSHRGSANVGVGMCSCRGVWESAKEPGGGILVSVSQVQRRDDPIQFSLGLIFTRGPRWRIIWVANGILDWPTCPYHAECS